VGKVRSVVPGMKVAGHDQPVDAAVESILSASPAALRARRAKIGFYALDRFQHLLEITLGHLLQALSISEDPLS